MLSIYAVTVAELFNYMINKNLCANRRRSTVMNAGKFARNSREIRALQFFDFVSALICNLTSTDWRKRIRGDNVACGTIRRRRVGDLNGTIPLCCHRNWRDLSRNRLQQLPCSARAGF